MKQAWTKIMVSLENIEVMLTLASHGFFKLVISQSA